MTDTYNGHKVVRRWYEAWLPTGQLWCGSSDPLEVARHAEGVEGVTYTQLITYERTKRLEWDPRG